jgi:exopolyphosphatase/pppGpp-phosphohydrolase
MNQLKKKCISLLFFIFLYQTSLYSQDKNLYAGIEIGSKGIKVSVIEINRIQKGDFEIKTFWTDNVGIAKGISIDGNLASSDIDNAIQVIDKDYKRIRKEFEVSDENIFIVGSSGVAMAKNTEDLIIKVKEITRKDLDFIDAETEGKMLMKGCVPPKYYKESMVLDIGAGNTKGGYTEVLRDEDYFVFFPLSLQYGTVTLTEAVIKKMKNKNDLDEFNAISFDYLPILRKQITKMYASSPISINKEKVYLSGGAVWAFYTLYYGETTESFNSFKLEDVQDYDGILKNNFRKFEKLAETNPMVAQVLKTYSQKHLISGNNILLECLQAIDKIKSKKLFFAKEGQIAWLVSYVVDRSKKVKKIY